MARHWHARPNRAGQLDRHHGALRVNWALFSDEGCSLTANRPDLDIWRRFADDGRHYASDSTEVDLDLIVSRLSRRTGQRTIVFAHIRDNEFHQSWFGC